MTPETIGPDDNAMCPGAVIDRALTGRDDLPLYLFPEFASTSLVRGNRRAVFRRQQVTLTPCWRLFCYMLWTSLRHWGLSPAVSDYEVRHMFCKALPIIPHCAESIAPCCLPCSGLKQRDGVRKTRRRDVWGVSSDRVFLACLCIIEVAACGAEPQSAVIILPFLWCFDILWARCWPGTPTSPMIYCTAAIYYTTVGYRYKM